MASLSVPGIVCYRSYQIIPMGSLQFWTSSCSPKYDTFPDWQRCPLHFWCSYSVVTQQSKIVVKSTRLRYWVYGRNHRSVDLTMSVRGNCDTGSPIPDDSKRPILTRILRNRKLAVLMRENPTNKKVARSETVNTRAVIKMWASD